MIKIHNVENVAKNIRSTRRKYKVYKDTMIASLVTIPVCIIVATIMNKILNTSVSFWGTIVWANAFSIVGNLIINARTLKEGSKANQNLYETVEELKKQGISVEVADLLRSDIMSTSMGMISENSNLTYDNDAILFPTNDGRFNLISETVTNSFVEGNSKREHCVEYTKVDDLGEIPQINIGFGK
jgi:hypothetical protein